MLGQAGFTWRPSKGSHTVWSHPKYQGIVTIAGNDGSDAPRYMEKQTRQAVQAVEEAK